ncbi:YkvA family protein [Ramlibacter humi]|uniref:DUF1232 domain-containing protein n=1 Tax=Ramlibacter humi TaxID=2530451 RepID=A0A4Z0BR55_9BURK|nr:YkvA family protein [Ramlibacter humi]TFZ01787.1 DUF1232 domain-containing protein [Ramlibacter humi]
MAGWIDRLRTWARGLKRESVALWFACQDPGMPWTAKALALFTVGYALSPIDLIPDFIPVLGFVDDAILLPALIWLTLRLVPPPVIERARARADEWLAQGRDKPSSRAAAVVIIVVWLAAAVALAWAVKPRWLAPR